MKPTQSVHPAIDDDSEGEEEVLGTWKASGAGKITVVPNNTSKIQTVTHGSQTKPLVNRTKITESSMNTPAKSQITPSTSNGAPVMTNPPLTAQTKPQSAAPIAPRPPISMKAIWYLGGNHVVKLLTSVDGDLDPNTLSKLAAVPPVVGELALSVEALVSDDLTVGGFEHDLLAKIASNTLAAKRASTSQGGVPNEVVPGPAPVAQLANGVPSAPAKPNAVPNPLGPYKPVPNPLARITPPGSPISSISYATEKRKGAPQNNTQSSKRSRISATTTMIQAR